MKWNDAMIRMRTHGTRSSVVSCHFIVIACIASRGCSLYVSGCSVMVSTCVCGLMAFYVEDRSCAHEQQHITGLLSKLPKRSLLLFYSYLFWIKTKKNVPEEKHSIDHHQQQQQRWAFSWDVRTRSLNSSVLYYHFSCRLYTFVDLPEYYNKSCPRCHLSFDDCFINLIIRVAYCN